MPVVLHVHEASVRQRPTYLLGNRLLVAAIEKWRDIDHRNLVKAFALRTQLVVQSGNEIYGHWTPWFDGGRPVDLGPFVLVSSTAKYFCRITFSNLPSYARTTRISRPSWFQPLQIDRSDINAEHVGTCRLDRRDDGRPLPMQSWRQGRREHRNEERSGRRALAVLASLPVCMRQLSFTASIALP